MSKFRSTSVTLVYCLEQPEDEENPDQRSSAASGTGLHHQSQTKNKQRLLITRVSSIPGAVSRPRAAGGSVQLLDKCRLAEATNSRNNSEEFFHD